MTTWTTIQYRMTEDGLMEFKGPRVKAYDLIGAENAAARQGHLLSDIYIKPPIIIRLRIFIKSIFK